MNENKYINQCRDCAKVFYSNNKKDTLCAECRKYKKSNKSKKQKKNNIPSILQTSRIERIYNTVNGTIYHYGKISEIIRNTNADRCVCCGEIIPEGRFVCPKCEKAAER